MIRYRAAWVLPISRPPMPDGVVTADRGRIVGVEAQPSGPVEDLGRVAILPGLVNAHTHLELSWMRGEVPPASSMPDWASTLIARRQAAGQDATGPIVDAIAEARNSGTCLVGDISNSLASYAPLVASDLSAAIFHELIGFSTSDPDMVVALAEERLRALPATPRLRPTLAPHAPYSVSPGLFVAIARHAHGRPLSVHLGESRDEVHFLRDATGAWRELLEKLGAWVSAWSPPACDPVSYLDRLGLVDSNLLAVHGVQMTDAELTRLASAGSTLATCPRSNQWTGAGVPPVARFYESGVRVAVGTDSLASVQNLNVFEELAEMRRLAPSVPAAAMLRSATLAGAEALGFDAELGSLDPGKQARMIAVRVPADVQDVEEYLLSGIQPFDIRWVEHR
jgi:cytosine/adenosine deaminase-related metal-dependent hydrolase